MEIYYVDIKLHSIQPQNTTFAGIVDVLLLIFLPRKNQSNALGKISWGKYKQLLLHTLLRKRNWEDVSEYKICLTWARPTWGIK